MRESLSTLVDDFRRLSGAIAVVRYQGNRRRVTTYAELARLAGRFAALLERRGIEKGDRVLLWGENSAEWLAAFYGCLLRGALAVPLDAHGSAEFALRVAGDVKPKLAVGDALLLAQMDIIERCGQSPAASMERIVTGAAGGAPESLAFPRLAFEDWLAELPAEEAGPVEGLSCETPLEILFTSGTTGDPKGIVLTHGNVLASIAPIEEGARPYMRYEWLVRPLRILHTLPLSHVFGQAMGLWIPSILRAQVHFEIRPAAPRLVQLIRQERISVLAAVPRLLALLKAHLEMEYPMLGARVEQAKNIGPARKWWRFRKVHRAFGVKFWAFVSGGGALAGPLEQFWNGLGFVLVQGYGMTETTALITLNHPFHVARGTIGKPLAARDVKLGPDGEVLVRGPMISGATWQGGEVTPRRDEWLATGDLAEKQESGELKFLGRKSEVIVTAAGMNLHPEDMETALEDQPGVAACAVVAMETATGPEPCAVLAVRGSRELAAQAIEQANEHLAEFQRVRRWVLWPEPDLPRTSTGKVRRKAVAAWLAAMPSASNGHGYAPGAGNGSRSGSQDWVLALIAQITGETPSGVDDKQRLTEDLHLDSLGRVQLASAIEERLGIVSGSGLLEETQTLGELRRLAMGGLRARLKDSPPGLMPEKRKQSARQAVVGPAAQASTPDIASSGAEPKDPSVLASSFAGPSISALSLDQPRTRFVYPEWPWWKPVVWLRTAFIELVMRPLVWLLANPRVVRTDHPLPAEPMLIVSNHVSTYDGPLVQYALQGHVRRRVAAAMLGEMLEQYRHWRNPQRVKGGNRFYLLGPAVYYLVTALFNVFPLPRNRDFQTSFAHTGKAMDRGYNVLVFPEGTRSEEGRLAQFRAGIGLLTRLSGAPVLPVAIRGLGKLKTSGRWWFRSGSIEVCVGKPIHFAPQETETAITARLHDEVEKLLG